MVERPNHRYNGSAWVWPSVIGGGAALVNAFWILAYGSINTELTRLQKEIDRSHARAEETYTKRENTEQYRQKVVVELKNLQTEDERLIAQIRRLRDDTLLKETYFGRHEAVIDDVKRANTRIDELRKDFGSSYTLSDKIKELQDQIKVIQSQSMKRMPESKT